MKAIPRSATKQQKESVKTEHVGLVASGEYDKGAVLAWLPKGHACTTACWSFHADKHQISIASQAFKHIDKAPASVKASLTGYLKSLYRHERGHALYTVRDLEKVQDQCKAEGVPFSLLNLFEDARIEALTRKATKNKFRWTEWEESTLDPAESDPIKMFFYLVQQENKKTARDEVRDLPVFTTAKGNNKDSYLVLRCYKEAQNCLNTYDVIAWVKYFIEHYEIEPADAANGVEGATGGKITEKGGDMAAAADASDKRGHGYGQDTSKAGPDFLAAVQAERDREIECENRHNKQKDSNASAPWAYDQSYASGREGKTHNYISKKDANTMANALNGMRAEGKGKTLADHGKRVSMKSLATLRLGKLFEGKDESNKAKPKVLVLTDMSGSMKGAPIQNALAINLGIAQSTAVDSTHVFTSKHSAHRLEQDQVTYDELSKAWSYSGSEGIATYIEKHGSEGLYKYDAILCLTDGCLTDGKPDWKLLERKGMSNIAACYVGESDYSHRLKTHFKKHLSVKTVEDLAARIKQLLS